MTKSKTEKHKVEYKGRFVLNKNQVNSDTAHRLLMKCSSLKKRNLVKTTLKLHESGFHIGHVSGLVNIRKLWFYFKDVNHYFVFGSNPRAVVIVTYVKEKYLMSYFCFINEDSLNRLTNAMDNLKPRGHDNPEYIDETIEPAENKENIDMECENENPENECDVENFIGNSIDEDDENNLESIHEDDENNLESIHEDPVEVQQNITTENIYVKQNSKIDNVFQSSYGDLFIESDCFQNQTNDEFSNEGIESELTEIIGGSMYLFSENFVVPVLELYGVCESEDEDV